MNINEIEKIKEGLKNMLEEKGYRLKEDDKMEIKNARITGTELGYSNGLLVCWLNLTYNGTGQGFGGNVLDEPVEKDGKFVKRVGTAWGLEFIMRILDTVGVESWEELEGKHIRVKATHEKVHEIGNILKDEWFNPSTLMEEMGQYKPHNPLNQG